MTCIINYFAYVIWYINDNFTQSLSLSFVTSNKLDLLVYLLENVSQIRFIIDKQIFHISKGLFSIGTRFNILHTSVSITQCISYFSVVNRRVIHKSEIPTPFPYTYLVICACMCKYAHVHMHGCVYVCIYMYGYEGACVYIYTFIYCIDCFSLAFLTTHHFGVCLDDICFIVILLNNKSHVIFMTCIIDYFAYRHLYI